MWPFGVHGRAAPSHRPCSIPRELVCHLKEAGQQKPLRITGIDSSHPRIMQPNGQAFSLRRVGKPAPDQVCPTHMEFMGINQNITENFTYNLSTKRFVYTILIDLHESSLPFESGGTCVPIF